MNVIILAAGVSRRLYPLTYNQPKCLLDVGEKAIIDYQIQALQESGLNRIVVVVGYYRERLMEYLQSQYPEVDFQFIVNHHFFETNTAYSVYLCREEFENGPFILMNADVLYPRPVMKRIVDSEHDSVLAVEVKPCGREEVKVIEGASKRIVAIGKELIQENALGEFIGVAKFSESFSRLFAESLEKLIQAGGKADYFEAAIHRMLSKTNLYYEDVSDFPTIEIDFIEDLDKAKQLVQSDWFN